MKDLLSLLCLESDTDSEKMYQRVLPYFVKVGLFSPLEKGNFVDFHKKLYQLSGVPHGVGLSVGIMAQVNIAGYVLKKSKESGDLYAETILNEIVNGEKIASMGVSEKNWNGRLTSLKSKITLQDGNYFLNAEKSFLTNGSNADYFLIVVKDITHSKIKVVCIPKDNELLDIENFSLPFAKEATHVRFNCENFKLSKNQILEFDYKKDAENLRLSEILTLGIVFCGWVEFILKQIVKFNINLHKDETFLNKILRIIALKDLLYHRILQISELRDKDQHLKLIDYFPFGYEEITDSIILELEILCKPNSLNEILQKELGLFKWRDGLHRSYLRKASLKMIKELSN